MTLNRFLSKLEWFICRPKLNMWATFYINFRLCHIKDAIHFPLCFYGPVFLAKTEGRVEFPNGCHRKMVTFGKIPGFFYAPKGKVFLMLEPGSKIVFHGKCRFAFDTAIRLTRNALLELENNVRVGDAVKIMSENKIYIGENSEITFNSQIIDTNFHYMQDTENLNIHRKTYPVIIGKNNWIGNHTSIMKGTVLPNDCIVASGSLINKDYSQESNVILAGSPAKVVKKNVRRVYSVDSEKEISVWFENHIQENFYNQKSFIEK